MRDRRYTIEVEGELSDLVRHELGVVSLRHERGNTVLEARVRDQAELQGFLQRLSGLGLTLVSMGLVRSGAGTDTIATGSEPAG